MNRAVENKLARLIGEVYASEGMHPGSSLNAIEHLAGRIGREILAPLGYDEVSFREAWMDGAHALRVRYADEGNAAEAEGEKGGGDYGVTF